MRPNKIESLKSYGLLTTEPLVLYKKVLCIKYQSMQDIILWKTMSFHIDSMLDRKLFCNYCLVITAFRRINKKKFLTNF